MKKNRKIAIRVDAGLEIGVGHFMRTLSLAESLKERGAHVTFLSSNLPECFKEVLISKQFKYIFLHTEREGLHLADELPHANWLGGSQSQDANATIKALDGDFLDWLIVDHYSLDFRWESKVRRLTKAIMVIDDLADRQHDCDILLDQNYFDNMRTRYYGKVPAHCRLMLGPSYALLRDNFRLVRESIKVRSGKVKNVLVFFGGVDICNHTMLAIEALSEVNMKFDVNVVIGAQHPFKKKIQEICIKYGYMFHEQITYMAKLMAEADLAIGAGGTASWERCCLGLPAIVVAVADNQINIANSLNSIQACVYIGPKDSLTKLSLKQGLTTLLSNPEKIVKISQNAYNLVDGIGASRVLEEMGF